MNLRGWLLVLERLAKLLAGAIESQKQKRRQKNRDALEEDPADWFNNHFPNGMHNNMPKTDQADTQRDEDAGRRDVS